MSVLETLNNHVQLIAGLPYKFEVQQMLEEPQWELIFEKTRWIIEKYRFCHRYMSISIIKNSRFRIFVCLLLMSQHRCVSAFYSTTTCFSFNSSVPMDKIFHRDSDLTCLQKVSFLLAFLILNVFFKYKSVSYHEKSPEVTFLQIRVVS